MFGRRTVQVDVVKKKTEQNTSSVADEIALEKKRAWVSATIQKSIVKIGIAVCAYVILDTARQVAVEAAKSE
jgi:hypothetical protein